MIRYEVHGIRFESELEFPELRRSGETPDVSLRVRPLGVAPAADDIGPNWARSTPDETTWLWTGFAAVRVRGGREITVDPCPDVSLPLLRMTVLGPVFSALLFQRGFFPLHASALAIRGRAIAITGTAGAGKSSLAAAMRARGHHVVADDVTATQIVDGHAQVFAGPPRLKLDPAILDWLGESSDELPPAPGDDDKVEYPVEGVPLEQPLPLRGIYVLGDGPSPRVDPLSEQEAFLEISRNCHRVELMVGAAGPRSYMHRCAELARRIPVYRLVRPRSIDRLAELAQRLEEHVGR